ncbi:MAG: acnA [Rhizobacter sp.]|nr:acnA [Rhizobacter sp.]
MKAPIPVTQLSSDSQRLHVIDLQALAAQAGMTLASFPYVIRVLLENLCRHHLWSGGTTVTRDEVASLLDWRANVGMELPLHVARVILPDSSGVPVLQDLAALRDAVARRGGDPASVDMGLPVDLVVDHSLQVDAWGRADAMQSNVRREFERNAERYAFIKWAQQAFKGLRVFPPGTGIVHQVNLEQVAQVVMTGRPGGNTQHGEPAQGDWAFPDFVIGGDSHTPMVNALGVLGWGVGGIDAEAALLGRAYSFPIPEVVGVRLHGSPHPLAYTTDLALRVTEVLRREGVVNCAVEFFGPAVASLPVAERATLSNMAPEYGATCGFFPVDVRTLDYLAMTGRSPAQVRLVEAYGRKVGLFRAADAAPTTYSRVIEIDLSTATPSLAGPRRPQDRIELGDVAGDFRGRLVEPVQAGGFGAASVAPTSSTSSVASTASLASASEPPPVTASTGAAVVPLNSESVAPLRHGSIVIAALTSCTNTSNPQVMLAAGIVARKAVERGLAPPSWVKRSLAPGSRAVTRYLQAAGLLAPLATLGFDLIGYGCTTCAGKSGPLDAAAAAAIERDALVAVAVLSGNRNFEGRIHKLVRANYIGAPPLVVVYALAGRIDIDLDHEPLGVDRDGRPVHMADLLPTADELDTAMAFARDPALYGQQDDGFDAGAQAWADVASPTGDRFAWDLASHYLVEPPFFEQAPAGIDALAEKLKATRVLAAFGDSVTTDHISPGGEIPSDTPAGQYLRAAGIAPRDFNSHVARRGNHHVMTRATFANIRVRNLLVPDREGGFTRHFPEGDVTTVFDAAERYRAEGITTLVLAGKDYGTGSSRDWAAKGSQLLGVGAVIAESFERIHRANLVGMGVLPLAFQPGEGWRQLGLDGSERYAFEGVHAGIESGSAITVTATRHNGDTLSFKAVAQVLTAAERTVMADGGVPGSVLKQLL